MNYSKIYNQLVERAYERASTRKQANLILGYSERHHILPKCMGGSNDKTNLVFLLAREHFIAHLLLVKIYPKEKKLLYACHRLLYDKQGNKLNGKSYDWIKRKISEYRKTINQHNHTGIKIGADKRRGRTIENYEPFAIGSAKQRGRTKETHDGPRKISKKKKGQTKEACSGTARMAEKLTGRTKEEYEYLRLAGEKRSILPNNVKAQIIDKRNCGQTFSSIHRWVVDELHFNVAKSTISNLFYRANKSISSTVYIC